MNYLFHLFLSDPDDEVLLGNLMGDFVKGRLEQTDYPTGVLRGLKQHRQIDTFANYSSAYLASRHRIDPEFGYFRSIMVDVFYDHLLARSWERYHERPLEQFAAHIYRLLEKHCGQLPNELQQIAPRMIEHNWLASYQHLHIIDRVLTRIDQRITRHTPLPQGLRQLELHYNELEIDFDRFLNQAQAFLRRESLSAGPE